ncbi:hypothetical protein HNR51_001113 [Methylorubrum thiocyanatum]|uniref:Uncharacterized protein n=2 Tax=Methylorubrum TaxID=2282523 RepID=A0A833J2F1_9HYPH|nr:hypothetical protein [Methylorubrum populi]KAB7782402.1 hypothetical protein F8B43_5157 [Methylorubrum populi]MBA8912045.1 hypothetical protein [Methylorubrum thiocyanatum]GJE79662.1 hypothetical protein CJNNKLLH_0988 [Methylorubrum thiocyanatum]
MGSVRASAPAQEPSCLYPDEAELARVVLGPKRAKAWGGLAAVLERSGLPKVDPMMGGRYWPAVREFLDRYHHTGDHASSRRQGRSEEGVHASGARVARARS